ncbi:tetratricopeptide repeat protein 31-like [Cyprinodon tularosa]|uniref:tetratricopeptide repeat protein 31-like n=1 Tax=Cyprinodon tularosa TaxID=77115 RepID=UPI0018E248F3|nr:tetratricopeptide repeat protein 31-like [Cyprinodon tularosa]
MQAFDEETEITDFYMMQKVVGLFGNQPHMQRIITCGLLGVEYDPDIDLDDCESWAHRPKLDETFVDDRLIRGRARGAFRSEPPLQFYSSIRGTPSPPAYTVWETDSERKARLLQETKKSKEKAEKKRLKKQKRKQRKQMEKEKQNPAKTEEENVGEQSKSEESTSKSEESTSNNHQKKKNLAAARDTDSDSSSGQESSDEDEDAINVSEEELDLTSSFVSKAALIAQRKLEQRPKSEKKDKRKTPEKEKPKGVPDKTAESKEAVYKVSSAASVPTLEDNVKISTDLAIIGNKFASDGDYAMAVKYFTDAIKYNPKEFKLFGNRSFCFERMQEYEKALTDAELSLSFSPGWVKGLFRKGRALVGLKRYEEAADAFRDVLKRDSSYAEAAQELMRVQIIQLMAYGFTREQSSNALIIHGTVDKALEVLSKLHHPKGAVLNGPLPPAQVANITGVSPVLSANSNPVPAASAPSYEASRKPLPYKPLGQHQVVPYVENQPESTSKHPVKINSSDNRSPPELFPVWVGNLTPPVTEAMISRLFSKAGPVFSVKLLSLKRCAFVNFTKQEHCDEAIKQFHGYHLHGLNIAVRYPDRIPQGKGMSRYALRARDLQD